MIKALSATAIAAFAAAAITFLPSFAPPVEAGVPQTQGQTLGKADRLPVHAASAACAGQNWPNIDVSCLRRSKSKAAIQPVRVVTTDRS